MNYGDAFHFLQKTKNYNDDFIALFDGLCLRNFDFFSQAKSLLPGGVDHYEDEAVNYLLHEKSEPDFIQAMINKTDAEITENLIFRYHMIMPAKQQRSKGIVIILHGFNEKYWDKYLPWATYIVKKTGKAVILFPLAFHMNRAPSLWSEPRLMYNMCKKRKERHPNIICSTLSNVAISTRLHNKPQRFIWSGLQSYRDLIDLVENIKSNKHPAIEPEASIDFCSYSIGSFLGQVVMMTNENGYFSASRYVTFCGGAVFNRLSPVSKFILDSEADVGLYSYLVEHLDSHIRHNESLRFFLNHSKRKEGINFQSMLNYKVGLTHREDKLRNMQKQFYAIALAKDEVVPSYEVMHSLQGSMNDIAIPVDVLDYPYDYRHEDPFPALVKIAPEVDRQFKLTFNRVCDFLGGI